MKNYGSTIRARWIGAHPHFVLRQWILSGKAAYEGSMREKTLLYGALSATAVAAVVGVLWAQKHSAESGRVEIAPLALIESSKNVQRAEIPVQLTSSDGTGLKLVALKAEAAVEDPLALTELHLTFENPESRVLEGTFRITLPQGASMSRFAMKVGDTWQEGEVVEKQAARQAYEDFLHRKQDPALMEQGAGNEFTARVFPIPANGTKEIIVTYAEAMTLGQSYVLPLQGLPQLGSLDVNVHVQGQKAGESGGKTDATFGIHQQKITPAGDFVVDNKQLPRSLGLRNGDVAIARVVPFASSRPEPVESAVVLLDTSASRGLGIGDQVKELRATFAKLPPDTKISVACFDQEVVPVYEGTAGGFGDREASAIIARGALGASDFEGALGWATTQAKKVSAKRVVLFTDGVATAGETDGQKLRAKVEGLRGAGVNRLDAVAIGGIRDDGFLRTLTRGVLDRDGVVLDAKLGADALARRLGEATSAAIAVKVDGARWSWPQSLEGLQAGDEVLVYAQLDEGKPLKVDIGGQQFAPDLRTAERPLVERAWAQAKIGSLVEAPNGAPAATKAEIIALSTTHRVLSPYTALLVLETDADYRRFNIDRNAKVDILAVEDGRVAVTQGGRVQPAPTRAKSEEGADKARGGPRSAAAPPPPAAAPVTRDEGAPSGAMAPQADRNSYDDSPSLGGMPAPTATAVPADGLAFGAGGGAAQAASGQGTLGGLGAPGAPVASAAAPPVFAPLAAEPASPAPTTAPAPPAPRPAMQARPRASAPRPLRESDEESRSARRAPPRPAQNCQPGDPLCGEGGDLRQERNQPAVAANVRAGALSELQGIAADEVQRVVRGAVPQYRACYQTALSQNSTLSGHVAVRFTISANGEVRTADVTDGPTSDVLRTCFAASSRNLHFVAPGASGAQFVQGFDLVGGGTGTGSQPNDPSAKAAPYDGRFKIVMDAINRGDKDSALGEASRWHAESPGDVLSLVALGEVFEARSDLRSAARAYGSILELFSFRADSRRFAGERLERLHDAAALALAADTYGKAVEQRPDHPASHRLYAYALLKKGDHEKAFEAIRAGAQRTYPGGRFLGVDRILREDMGLVAAAWMHAEPGRASEIRTRLSNAGGHEESSPSLRFVLNWETDANDVDFHIYDGKGGHAYYANPALPSGGELYADVTTGYGPECFTIRNPKRSYPYTLQAHYFARGPMGYGMGKLEVIDHDGKGNLTFEERPFVVMVDHAFVDMGRLEKKPLVTASR